MRWIGWILFVLTLLAAVGAHQVKTESNVNEKKRVDAEIARKTEEVERLLATASAGIPELESRHNQEQGETKTVQAQLTAIQEKETKLTRRVTELENSINSLRSAKDNVQTQRRENMGEIKELQQKVDLADKQNSALKKALETVSPKVGL